MSTQPSFPLLIVDSKGWLGMDADGQKRRFSLLGAVNTRRWTGYDSAGAQWRVLPDSFPYPNVWWTRLLANLVFNPRFEVELRWEATGTYALSDLQASICRLVDKDDDLLTQFVEADKIKEAVRACKTFDELVRRLQRMRIIGR